MKKTSDRNVWAEYIRNWWNQPLTKEQKDEIDNMSEAKLVKFVLGKVGSRAQRNYMTAKLLEKGAIEPEWWVDYVPK